MYIKKRFRIFLGLLSVSLVIGAGCNTQVSDSREGVNTEPIKIGFIGPLTGTAASLGENMRTAVEIARDEVNAEGGINGRALQIIFEDGQCGAEGSISAGNKLLSIDKVDILMPICSGEVLGLAPIAEAKKRVLLSPVATSPDITSAGDYIFRLMPSDHFQGKFAAQYVYDVLGVKKVAVLFEQIDATVGVKNVFTENFLKIGGKVVIEESVLTGETDMRSSIVKIKNSGAEFVYFASFPDVGMVGLKQMKELDVGLPIFGVDTFDDANIPSMLGSSSDGVKYSVAANQDLPEVFVDKMSKRTSGEEIAVYSPRVYDAVKILASIMTRVGTDNEKIKEELYALRDYQGIADIYTLDENGDVAIANYKVKQYQGGKIIEL